MTLYLYIIKHVMNFCYIMINIQDYDTIRI